MHRRDEKTLFWGAARRGGGSVARTRRGRALGWAVAVVACGLARPAAAGGPIGENGEQISTSRYGIDLFQGPVYAGSRVTGLGGAYVALGWDVDGMQQTPVA